MEYDTIMYRQDSKIFKWCTLEVFKKWDNYFRNPQVINYKVSKLIENE